MWPACVSLMRYCFVNRFATGSSHKLLVLGHCVLQLPLWLHTDTE